jgi:hypothetical protein
MFFFLLLASLNSIFSIEIPIYYTHRINNISSIEILENVHSHFSLKNINFHSLFLMEGGLPTVKAIINNGSEVSNLLLDTGSPFIGFGNSNCSCSNQSFDFNYTNMKKIDSQLYYFEGSLINIDLTINQQINIQEFNVFSINSSNFNFLQFDGIFGLNLINSLKPKNTGSFIQNLIDKKLVENNNFILHNSNENNKNLIIGSDISNSENDNLTHCHSYLKQHEKSIKNYVYYNDYWICNLSNIYFGEIDNFNSTITTNDFAIFSTGINYIVAPYKYISLIYNSFFFKFYKKECHEISEESIYTEHFSIICKADNLNLDDFQSFNLIFNGISYKIPPQDMFLKIQGSTGRFYYIFRVLFTFTENFEWIIGQPFLKQNELIIFDNDNLKIFFKNKQMKNFTKFVKDIKVEDVSISTQTIIIIGTLVAVCTVAFLTYIFRTFCCEDEYYEVQEDEVEIKVFKGADSKEIEILTKRLEKNEITVKELPQKSIIENNVTTTNLYGNTTDAKMVPKPIDILMELNKTGFSK